MRAEMFSIIQSRKSHAYILVLVRNGNEAWGLFFTLALEHVSESCHLATPCGTSRGPGVQRRGSSTVVGVGRDAGGVCLPSHPINKGGLQGAVGWPPNGSIMGC